MTGYTVHTGSTKKFSSGWDRIFSGSGRQGSAKKAGTGAAGAKKTARRRTAKGKG